MRGPGPSLFISIMFLLLASKMISKSASLKQSPSAKKQSTRCLDPDTRRTPESSSSIKNIFRSTRGSNFRKVSEGRETAREMRQGALKSEFHLLHLRARSLGRSFDRLRDCLALQFLGSSLSSLLVCMAARSLARLTWNSSFT